MFDSVHSPIFNRLFLHPQARQVKDGQAARVPRVGLVMQEHQGGRVIQVPQDHPDHQDTVTRTLVWGTTSEVNITQLLSFNNRFITR